MGMHRGSTSPLLRSRLRATCQLPSSDSSARCWLNWLPGRTKRYGCTSRCQSSRGSMSPSLPNESSEEATAVARPLRRASRSPGSSLDKTPLGRCLIEAGLSSLVRIFSTAPKSSTVSFLSRALSRSFVTPTPASGEHSDPGKTTTRPTSTCPDKPPR